MRQWILLAAALALAGVPALAHDHGDHGSMKAGAAEEKATIEGQVVDLACYLGHGEIGDKHGKCAKACVVGGAPAGLLGVDGTLYLLVEDHAHPKPYDQAKRLAGEKASVSGRVVKKGGLAAIVVGAAEKK